MIDFQNTKDAQADRGPDDGAVNADPGQIFSDLAFQKLIKSLFIESGQDVADGDGNEGVFMFQDDIESPADLFIKPFLDFRIRPTIFQIVDELFFQQIFQLFPALFAGHKIIFR